MDLIEIHLAITGRGLVLVLPKTNITKDMKYRSESTCNYRQLVQSQLSNY